MVLTYRVKYTRACGQLFPGKKTKLNSSVGGLPLDSAFIRVNELQVYDEEVSEGSAVA